MSYTSNSLYPPQLSAIFCMCSHWVASTDFACSSTGCINLEIVVSPVAMETKYDCWFKIVLIGDPNVGKTSIVRQYIDGNFRTRSTSTHGVDFSRKSLRIGSSAVKVIPCLVNRSTCTCSGIIGSPRANFSFGWKICSYHRPATKGKSATKDIIVEFTVAHPEKWMIGFYEYWVYLSGPMQHSKCAFVANLPQWYVETKHYVGMRLRCVVCCWSDDGPE